MEAWKEDMGQVDGSNARWAHYWARRYRWALEDRGDLDYEDLVQAALLGIWRARKSYRPEAGSWATYSARFIKGEIFRALGVRRGVMPPATLSLDAPVSEESGEPLMNSLPDENAGEPDAALLSDELGRTVRRAVARLKSPRQRLSVQRAELEGEAYSQVASELGVTPERARQLVRAAHKKLRQDRRLKALAECELRTRYHAHMGVKAFMSSHTSVVEKTVIWRLEQMEKMGEEMRNEE